MLGDMIGYVVIEEDLGYMLKSWDLGYMLKSPALYSACFEVIAFWYYEVKRNISTFPFLLLLIFLGTKLMEFFCLMESTLELRLWKEFE